jgi:myo-inositol-1(or 4)-monophosphatase
MNHKEIITEEAKGSIIERFAYEVIDKLPSISSYLAEKYELIQHEGFQAAQDVENEADLFIAKEWVDFVQTKFPSFNIDTEEALGKINISSRYTVRVDSIDGSKHFRAGIPIFGSNISLRFDNETLFGACIDPMLRETYYAIKGKGAYRNGSKIAVSAVDSIQNAFIALEGPTSKLAKTNYLAFQSSSVVQDFLKQNSFRVRDFGLGAFGICLVANGSCAGYVDISGTTKTYDIEAALHILQEAGGKFSDFVRPEIKVQSISDISNHVIIASNGLIHQELLNILHTTVQ